MNSSKQFGLAVFSGILLSLGWPAIGGIWPLLFIGFTPLLLFENFVFKNRDTIKSSKVFYVAFVGFAAFNLGTTWWIYFATFSGLLFSVILNSFFMSVVFWLFHVTKRIIGASKGWIIFIIYWIGFEYLHLFWDFSFPWLNLGNALSNAPKVIQWYEFTGALGGTFWILALNLIAFNLLNQDWGGKNVAISAIKSPLGLFFLGVLFIPIFTSLRMYHGFVPSKNTMEIVAVQPNIDPYNEKFTGDFRDHLERMLDLTESKITEKTTLAIFPETALQEPSSFNNLNGPLEVFGLWEDNLQHSYSVNRLRDFIKDHPNVSLLTGMTSKRLYRKGEVLSETARRSKSFDVHYDVYNSALFLNKVDTSIQTYYKSNLLIGVERMPFNWLFKRFENLIWQMGGTTGSLGVQEERSVFKIPKDKPVIAPIICLESVYGEFVTEYVQKGANVLCVITNDGWWDNTPGHRQHMYYGALRAIETRRSIARSANTGISCFVNPKGEIFDQTNWWVPDAIIKEISLEEEITFYTTYGDFLGRTAFFLSIALIIYAYVLRLKKKSSKIL